MLDSRYVGFLVRSHASPSGHTLGWLSVPSKLDSPRSDAGTVMSLLNKMARDVSRIHVSQCGALPATSSMLMWYSGSQMRSR
jgi:hypothetical protein